MAAAGLVTLLEFPLRPCTRVRAYRCMACSRRQTDGSSQWCSNCNGSNGTVSPHYVYNDWVDGTPVFLQPYSLWYPSDKKFCNKTGGGRGVRPSATALEAEADCIERIPRAVATENAQRPLFVPTYGVENYVDMAQAMQERLGSSEFAIVGTQDFAALGREAAPSNGRAMLMSGPTTISL